RNDAAGTEGRNGEAWRRSSGLSVSRRSADRLHTCNYAATLCVVGPRPLRCVPRLGKVNNRPTEMRPVSAGQTIFLAPHLRVPGSSTLTTTTRAVWSATSAAVQLTTRGVVGLVQAPERSLHVVEVLAAVRGADRVDRAARVERLHPVDRQG